MPSKQEKLQTDVDELQEDAAESRRDADRMEADLQGGETPTQHELRDVTIAIEVNLRTDDPDVTDEAILAAAEQQVTLPNTIWIDKPAGGQIAVSVISVGPHVEPPPPEADE